MLSLNHNRFAFVHKIMMQYKVVQYTCSSSFELFVVSFMQEHVYIGHTVLALTRDVEAAISSTVSASTNKK